MVLSEFLVLGAIVVTAVAPIYPILLHHERRLTRIEVKTDAMLNHNGVNPEGLVKAKKEQK